MVSDMMCVAAQASQLWVSLVTSGTAGQARLQRTECGFNPRRALFNICVVRTRPALQNMQHEA